MSLELGEHRGAAIDIGEDGDERVCSGTHGVRELIPFSITRSVDREKFNDILRRRQNKKVIYSILTRKISTQKVAKYYTVISNSIPTAPHDAGVRHEGRHRGLSQTAFHKIGTVIMVSGVDVCHKKAVLGSSHI